ncbi:MAG: ATP-dependent RNA helicase HrpA, partial [Methylococcales bacterium]
MHDLISQLSKQLETCLSKDKSLLKRQLDSLRRNKKAELSAFEGLRNRIEKSVSGFEKRRASFPALNFPDLPVTGKKDDIAELIKNNQVVIMCGETGSGKTTQLPKICLSIGRGAAGFIGHTQPRRIAARTVADRIAEE